MSTPAPGQAPGAGAAAEPPTVSVVIPTYNRAGLLEEAIDSVLCQDYPNIELVVMDDGSTDDTPAILRHYAKRNPPERFRWERHDNMGQARTLNRGYEIARGDVMGYLSSDDLFVPGAIGELVEALYADPEVVLVYPAYRIVDEGGDVLEVMTPPEHSQVEAVRLHSSIVHAGALFKRIVYERIGGWDPAFVYVADLDWHLRASFVGEFRLVPRPLASWRSHPESANRSPGLLAAREQTALLDKFFARDDLPEEVLAVKDEAYRNAYFVAAHAMGRVNARGSRFFAHDMLNRTSAQRGREREVETIMRLRRRLAGVEHRQAMTQRSLDRQRELVRSLQGPGGEDRPVATRARRLLARARARARATLTGLRARRGS